MNHPPTIAKSNVPTSATLSTPPLMAAGDAGAASMPNRPRPTAMAHVPAHLAVEVSPSSSSSKADNRKSLLFNDNGTLNSERPRPPKAGTLDFRRTTMMMDPNFVPFLVVEIPRLPVGWASPFTLGVPLFDGSYAKVEKDLSPYISQAKYAPAIAHINDLLVRGTRAVVIGQIVSVIIFVVAFALLAAFVTDVPEALYPMIAAFAVAGITLIGSRLAIIAFRRRNENAVRQYAEELTRMHGSDGRMTFMVEDDKDAELADSDWPWVLEVYLTPVPAKVVHGKVIRLDK